MAANIEFDYFPDERVVSKLDEEELALLGGRGTSKTWLKKAINECKISAYAIFESYAVNRYSLVQLRTDPPPEFAVDIVWKIFLYNLFYNYGNRHSIPEAIDEEYKRIMKVLESWGSPQIIGEGIEEDIVSGAEILYTKTEDDLKLRYEDQEGFFGNDI